MFVAVPVRVGVTLRVWRHRLLQALAAGTVYYHDSYQQKFWVMYTLSEGVTAKPVPTRS